MKVLKIFREKKVGSSFLLLFFTLLVVSLVLRNIIPGFYPVSVFFILLIFIFFQYFDFDYRLFAGFALALLILCPFLLIFKLKALAEYFANYVYCFLVLGIIGYFFDNLKEKLKSKGTIKIYKKVFLSILIIFLLSSMFIFIKEYWRNTDYAGSMKETFVKFADNTKDKYLIAFRKDAYYSGVDYIEVDGKKISRDIVINIDNPKDDSIISKTIDLSGWSIETNSIYNTGIDKIEFFLDGKPGNGKYLGKFSQNYYAELESKNYIINLYINFYDRMPSAGELDYWEINLEYHIMSYYEVANNIIYESKFMEESLSNEDFLVRLYSGLLNRSWDGTWIDRLGTDLARVDILYSLINSEEFKKYSEIYYENVSLKENDLDIIRKDVGEKYGVQFYLSGFEFSFDSTKFSNGEHTIYIYAHSPLLGWDYRTVDINIKN